MSSTNLLIITGFPFTVTSNPQYVGSPLSIWGLVVLMYTPEHIGLVVIAMFMSGCYAFSGYVEETM